jgi:hypothetical protein
LPESNHFASETAHFNEMEISIRDALKFFCLSIVLSGTFQGLCCVKINILAIIMDDNPVYGYPAQGPAFEVAFLHAMKKYPHSFQNASGTKIHEPGIRSCADAAALMPIAAAEVQASIEILEGFTVLIVTGNQKLKMSILLYFSSDFLKIIWIFSF